MCTLSVTWGRLAVVYNSVLRQSLLTNWRLSVGGVFSQLVQEGWQLSVSYMMQESGYLSATWDRIAVVCQLHEPGYRFSAENVRTLSNLKQDDGYLSATWWRLAVICQLHEAGWLLSVTYMRQGWLLSVNYMRQDGSYLSATLGRIAVVIMRFVYSVCALKRDGGCLSATWCRMAIVCQLHEPGYRFSAWNVCTMSVTGSGMAVVCQLHEAG